MHLHRSPFRLRADEDESEADLSDEYEDEGDSYFSFHEKKKTPAKKHDTPIMRSCRSHALLPA